MMMALWQIARSHVMERPVRTAMTVLGIALGVAVPVAIQTANVSVLHSFQEAVTAVAGRATLQVTGGETGFDERVIAVLRTHPAVTSATPVIQQSTMIASGSLRGKMLVVIGLDVLEAADLKSFRVKAGTEASASLDLLLEPTAIFIGKRLAEDWSLTEGDRLDLLVGTQVRRVVIRGVVESSEQAALSWEQLAVMDIAAAQRLFGSVGRLDRIDLVTDPARPVQETAEVLQKLLPSSFTVQRPTRRNEQVERMVRAFQLNLVILSSVGLLVGLLLVYNTVAYAVVQRRREIGIVRALGLSRGGVCTLFLCEAAAMGLIGGVLGSLFGAWLASHLVALVSRTVSELYVPVPFWSHRGGVFSTAVLLKGTSMGIVVSMIGALAPSLGAARTQPARALAPGDYEAETLLRAGPVALIGGGLLLCAGLFTLPGPIQGLPFFGYLSAFCLLLGLSCLAPLLLCRFDTVLARSKTGTLSRIAAEQIARAPSRNAVTVSALMVGVAIMIGVGLMIHSFRQTVEAWINQTVMADLVIGPPSWLQGEESGMQSKRMPLAWADLVAAVPGVAAVDTYRDLTVEIEGRPVALVSRDLHVHAARSRYLFVEGESGDLLRRTAGERGVMISEVLARTLNMKQGDALPLITPVGLRSFPVIGLFYDYATDGGKLVMDRSLYRSLWHDETTTVIAVYLAERQEAAAVRSRIETLLIRHGQVVVIDNATIKREILAIFDRTFAVTYALEFIAVVIALLGIVNTLLTSVLERQREMATLRAIGAGVPQIQRLVLWEALYLGLLGAALGMVGGVLLSLLLIHVINKQSFGWTIHFVLAPGLILQAMVLAVVAALAAGYLPARWASRQPVVDGLRYE